MNNWERDTDRLAGSLATFALPPVVPPETWENPDDVDDYDLGPDAATGLGTSAAPWPLLRASELMGGLFSSSAQHLMGGVLVVGHGEGILQQAAGTVDTTVEFGQMMTDGDFICFHAGGTAEYMTCGTAYEGTRYNVTRSVDSGGTPSWPAGTPYLILGQNGDGRCEVNGANKAFDVVLQGALYNAGTIIARMGNLNGVAGGTIDRYGLFAGDYAGGNYLKYDPTDGFLLKAGAGRIKFDANGETIVVGATQWDVSTIRWLELGKEVTAIQGWLPTATLAELDIQVNRNHDYAGANGSFIVNGAAVDGSCSSGLWMNAGDAATTSLNLAVSSSTTAVSLFLVDNKVEITGSLSVSGGVLINQPTTADALKIVRDNNIYLSSYVYSDVNARPYLMFRRARGSEASPAAVQSGDYLGIIRADGYEAATPAYHAGSQIVFFATETWDLGANGARIDFATAPNGGVSFTSMRLLGTVADGDMGLQLVRNVGGVITVQQVSMGAPNSGDTGFKYLRVPN